MITPEHNSENLIGSAQGSFSLATAPSQIFPSREAVERRAAFIERYKVEVFGPHEVAFEIPAGGSRIELIREAQQIAGAYHLYGRVVQPQQMEKWEQTGAFTTPVDQATRIEVNCVVAGSGAMTRGEQEELLTQRGLRMATLPDLAAAYAAFSMATEGRDAFSAGGRHYTVRADGGTLFSFMALTQDVFFPQARQYNEALVVASYR